jgi:hypothetical protein
MAIPQSQSNNENEQESLPFTSEIIGTVTGSTPPVINADRRRKIDYLAKDYTGCIVLVVNDGRIVKNGIYRVEQFIIGPTTTD